MDVIEDVVREYYAGNKRKLEWLKKNFEVCSNCTTIGPYDYHSVMHYESTLVVPEKTVISIVGGKCENGILGQRIRLSEQDVADIEKYYGCSKYYLSNSLIKI